MWEGELCFSPARGVGSEGSGGVPPAVYADPDFFFLLVGWKVCPTHPFVSPSPQSDRRGQQ